MARLTLAIAVALLLAEPARANPVDQWRGLIAEAALRFDMPEAWITRVMRAESAGQTQRNGRPIRSRVGAIGLMQLMPATWAEMRKRFSLGPDPDNPRDNILAGTAYLRLMFDSFGYPGCLAAYNAGPAAYAAYLAGRRSLPRETIAYVAKVTRTPAPTREDAIQPSIEPYIQTAPPLFYPLQSARTSDSERHAADQQAGDERLFVVRNKHPGSVQ
jgi:soluble lytic murein transglycosylase-like protein